MRKTIMIYSDPLTQKHPEGEAVLLRLLKTEQILWEGKAYFLQTWRVKFPKHGITANSKILSKVQNETP